MKRTFSLALISIALLVASIVFNWADRQAKAVTVQINVKDFPVYDLKLISPSDPSFEGRVSALLKGKRNNFIEALKPYSVFLKNASNKAVVGYWLKWEMTKPDGTVVSRETGGINPSALMDGGASGSEQLSLTTGYAVEPNSMRFISLAYSLGENEEGTISGYAGGSRDQAALDQFRRDKDKRPTSKLDRVIAELQSYTSINISIDGVFFQDGTFVGTNKTNFFVQVQANVDAKRDLLDEIAFAVKRNRSAEEILSDIEELAGSPNVLISPGATTTDYYNYYKRIYADEIVHMRNAMDSQRAIAMSLQALRKQWPKLKRL
jgi:hypothetical protein